MSLNWREIEAVLAEIPLAGSQIQQIRQPDFSSLILELYRPEGRYSLYISLSQNATRIHRLTQKIETTVPLQRFAQLLRSRLKNARITSAAQIGSERIIKLEMTRSQADMVLWIRLWNNAANILLTDPEGKIIDAYFRRPGRGEISGGTFSPDLAVRNGAGKEYAIRDFPGAGDLNSRIAAYYSSTERTTETGNLKQRLEKKLAQMEAALRIAMEAAQDRTGGEQEIERYRQTGNLIMSNIHTVSPGQRRLTVEDFYRGNETVSIELDPALTPEKNAERYYNKARKLERKLNLAREEIESTERELADVLAKLDALKTEEDTGALRRMLKSVDNRAKKVETGEKDRLPGMAFQSGGFTILVGRTARENDELLRDHVRGNDYWLHSRDTPGAYVFVKSIKGKSIPLEVLLDAGNLALHYSKARSSGRCDLYYTQVKYLRRVKNGKPGLVIPTQEKNLSIEHEESRLRRLLEST